MIEELPREEQDRLHHRYRNSDLFRHWSPLLCQLEWELEELDMTSVWWHTERQIETLRQTQHDRDEMIAYLFKQMREDFKSIKLLNGTTLVRTDDQAEQSAVTVMCVLMTQLMNAVEPEHEEEDFDNRPMCVAIANLLRNHPHFIMLMDRFFKRMKNNKGEKIVITPADPMNIEAVLAEMDETARKEIEAMIEKLSDVTMPIKSLLGDNWQQWENVCRKVCLSPELMKVLRDISPRNNDWGINQKMVCNMIGLFCNVNELTVSLNSINNVLADTNVGSYLRNHADFGGYNCAITRAQHNTLKKMMGAEEQ